MRNRLISIVTEMGAVLRRTAYSPNIREREDCSCVLADPQGQIIAQAEHIPGHLGMLTVGVTAALDRFPADAWSPGDVLIFNEPYDGGSHLPDIRMVAPIFFEGTLVGFAANLAHHADVGGMAPGSMPATATEVYQEGIQIPYIKLYEKGELNEAVLQMILVNVRTPEEREGDLRAQVASVGLGLTRVLEVIERVGLAQWHECIAEVLDYSERLMRAKIRENIPEGSYRAEMFIDDDGTIDEQIGIRVEVRVSDGNVFVDFQGTDKQREAAANCVWGNTVSASYFAVKAVVDPNIPVNSGCYRPIHVDAPVGSVVRATHPAAVAAGNESWQRVAECLIAALAKANPQLVKAPSHGCMNNVVFGGSDESRGGRLYTYYETVGGGEGAWWNGDGMDGVHVLGTNTMNTPVEVLEMNYPLRIERYELIPDSGGKGKFRGGLGIRRVYRVLGKSATLVFNSDWMRWKPPGLLGGETGRLTSVSVLNPQGEEVRPKYSKFIMKLGRDSVFALDTGGGNGFSNSDERSPEAIDRDILEGKTT